MKYFLVLLFFFTPVSRIYTQTIYFPVGKDGKYILPTYKLNMYSGALRGLQEAAIFTDKSGNEIYRFTWLREFHHPVVIRIEKRADSYLLFWKEIEGSRQLGSNGKIYVNRQKIIPKTAWDNFQALLKGLDFWNLETPKGDPADEIDGAYWLLEGKTNDKYHIADRWAPVPYEKFYQCCDFLISLTDLKIEPVDIY